MDFQKQVYAKTPIGDEAVRQSTRVVQRNLRMVLVQVDGKLNVEELSAKIGNPQLVEKALRELEAGGFVAPALLAPKVWEESKRRADNGQRYSAISQFSSFGASSVGIGVEPRPSSKASGFSSFGKPILPAASTAGAPEQADIVPDDDIRPRISLRWLKWVLLGIPLLLCLLAFFYPYDSFKPKIEAVTSAYLKTPVRIGEVSLSLWPRPALRLSHLRLGEDARGRIEEVRIASPHVLVGSGHREIPRIDLTGVDVSVEDLLAWPIFQEDGQLPDIEIARLGVRRLQVRAGTLVLSGLAGEIGLRAGHLDQSELRSEDNSLRLSLQTAARGLMVDVEAFGWRPTEKSFRVDVLQGKALVQPGRLEMRNLEGRMLGGSVRGNCSVEWLKGLVMAGDASLSSLDARQLVAAFAPTLRLDGEVSGSVRVRLADKGNQGLSEGMEGMLELEVTRGVLHGIDLGEAARRGAGAEVQGGATKFDRLRASLAFSGSQLTGRNVQLGAGMFSANGQFTVARGGAVDGAGQLTVNSSLSPLNLPVRIYGNLPDLTTAAGRRR